MRAPSQFFLLAIVAFLGAAVALSPRPGERSDVLAGEGRHKEAIALLERKLANDPHDASSLAALGRSFAAIGDIDRAIDALESYLAIRPDDVAAREKEATFLLQKGLLGRYLDELAHIVVQQPSSSRITSLLELYRLNGRVDDEIATLRTYGAKAMLTFPQLERLGALLVAQGDWGGARQWLDLADQKAPAEASAGRFMLLEVLIHSSEAEMIYDRARTWMQAWRDPVPCERLILRVARSGFVAQASAIALEYTDERPDDTFPTVWLLARKGYQELGHQMLARWAEGATKPTATQLRAFIQASALVGDINGPLVKWTRMVQSGADAATEAEMAEELATTFGTPALVAIRPLLSNEMLVARPLFSAELALFEGNHEMARWFLNQVEPAQIPPNHLKNWLGMLRIAETDADVFRRLTILWNDGRLPEALTPYLADEAARLGQAGVRDLILNSASR